MTQPTPMPERALSVSSYSPLGAFLSYLVPGLGQIAQGRIGKGLLFFVCLYGMFFGGMALGSWKNVYIVDIAKDDKGDPPDRQSQSHPPWANNPLHWPRPMANLYNRMHFLGQVWIGVAAWPAIWQYNHLPVPSREMSPFLHDYQRPPDDEEMSQLLAESDKTPDVAWVYTVIAGVLNILVIYDAFAGPAYVRRARDAKAQLTAADDAKEVAALPPPSEAISS
jgi:hypothetical protein